MFADFLVKKNVKISHYSQNPITFPLMFCEEIFLPEELLDLTRISLLFNELFYLIFNLFLFVNEYIKIFSIIYQFRLSISLTQ